MVGCSSGDANGSKASAGDVTPAPRTGTPCEQLAQTICPQMQACPEGDGSSDCKAIDEAPGSSNTVGFSCTMCRAVFEKDVCGDTTKTDALFQSCMTALDDGRAQCGASPSNPDEQGLVLPVECHTLFGCNSGPCED